MNFAQAKTALFLIDGLDSTSSLQIKEFSKFLKSEGIEVESLIFFDQKETNEVATTAETILTQKDLSWLGIPKKEATTEIQGKEFDLLFDFSIKQHFALNYVLSLSKAKFKIGMLPGTSAQYDFMIDLGTSRKISEFIKQIKHYLPLLNNNKK